MTRNSVAMSPTSYSNDVNSLLRCLASLHTCMFCENGMALNSCISVAIIFGTSQRVKSIPGSIPVNVVGTVIPLSDIGSKSLEPYSILTLQWITTPSQYLNLVYHIRSLRHIRSSLGDDMAVSAVASAIVSSRLDYVNSILLGCPQKHIARLQRAQNAL